MSDDKNKIGDLIGLGIITASAIGTTTALIKSKYAKGKTLPEWYYGYITGYKNVELLIDSAKFLKIPEWTMIIAGGSHPRLSNNSGYNEYISYLRKKASAISNRILFKGFIREEEVPLYFSAADLVVLPYTACISASGPLSLAISYERPFLVSDALSEILPSNYLVFRSDSRELANKIDSFFRDNKVEAEALCCLKNLKNKRLWRKVSLQTYKVYVKAR